MKIHDKVTLTAVPDTSSIFTGWSGDCSSCGTNTTCNVIMDTTKTCTATFTTKQYTITASVNPANTGTITCSPNPVLHGSTTTCTITPNTGYHIESVTGTCGGSLTGNTYTTNGITQDCTVIANLAITGVVTSSPAGINCGTDCQETYTHGTEITLTATPDPDSEFENWTGDCGGNNYTTTITMDNNNKTCTTNFRKVVTLNSRS